MSGDKAGAELSRAIAIKGNGSREARIVADGRGKIAERILDIAFGKGVKVREDKELVSILDGFEVDSPVPLEALEAVTRILQYVYRENQAMRQKRESEVAGAGDIEA